jgi:hypothetical protein
MSYAFGPLGALAALALLVALLRWTFSSTSRSLVSRNPRPGAPGNYGLLVSVASPGTDSEGETLRRTLEAAGLRATVTRTIDGPRVLVFAGDETTARAILARR